MHSIVVIAAVCRLLFLLLIYCSHWQCGLWHFFDTRAAITTNEWITTNAPPSGFNLN